MKRFLHYINDDIEEIRGLPRWEWLFIPNGIIKLTALLKIHAEFEGQYPEDKSEAND